MTEEEKKELEALRAEKHSREQTERARTALSTAGVSVGFAALLVGTDDADTDRRVQEFRRSKPLLTLDFWDGPSPSAAAPQGGTA